MAKRQEDGFFHLYLQHIKTIPNRAAVGGQLKSVPGIARNAAYVYGHPASHLVEELIGVGNLGLMEALKRYRTGEGRKFSVVARQQAWKDIRRQAKLLRCVASSYPKETDVPWSQPLGPEVEDLSTDQADSTLHLDGVEITDGINIEKTLIKVGRIARRILTKPRDQHIFRARYLTTPEVPLRALALKFDVTTGRVHQIALATLDKVRARLRADRDWGNPHANLPRWRDTLEWVASVERQNAGRSRRFARIQTGQQITNRILPLETANSIALWRLGDLEREGITAEENRRRQTALDPLPAEPLTRWGGRKTIPGLWDDRPAEVSAKRLVQIMAVRKQFGIDAPPAWLEVEHHSQGDQRYGPTEAAA